MKDFTARIFGPDKSPMMDAKLPVLHTYDGAEIAFQEMLIQLRSRFPESSGYRISVYVQLVEVTEYESTREYLKMNFRKDSTTGGDE